MTFDVGVVGGGIGGASVVRALALRGHRAALFTRVPRHSPLPHALLHPFPGRSADDSLALEAFARARAAVGEIGSDSAPFVTTTSMVRPVKEGDRLSRTAHKIEAEAKERGITIEWLEGDAARCEFPGVRADAVLAYSPVYSVAIPRLIEGWLQGSEVALRSGARSLRRCRTGWSVATVEGDFFCRVVILCPGAAASDWFPGIALELLAGATLLAHRQQPLEYSISHRGVHWAPVGRAGLVSIGATRHAPDVSMSDAEVRRSLLGTTLIDGAIEVESIWRGIRCVNRLDRRPLCGAIPGHPELYCLLALGSCGLLWAPFCAERLIDLIFDGLPMPATLSPNRVEGSFACPRVES